MADFDAVRATEGGAVVTSHSGAAAGTDTIPGGVLLLATNGGDISHNVVLAVAYKFHGLAVSSRTVAIAPGVAKAIEVPLELANADNRVGISVSGTGTEGDVTYQLLSS